MVEQPHIASPGLSLDKLERVMVWTQCDVQCRPESSLSPKHLLAEEMLIPAGTKACMDIMKLHRWRWICTNGDGLVQFLSKPQGNWAAHGCLSTETWSYGHQKVPWTYDLVTWLLQMGLLPKIERRCRDSMTNDLPETQKASMYCATSDLIDAGDKCPAQLLLRPGREGTRCTRSC